ncbi:MAG: hypothetical protein WCW16_03575 [Candidatus Magasanikbacteria bacterium]
MQACHAVALPRVGRASPRPVHGHLDAVPAFGQVREEPDPLGLLLGADKGSDQDRHRPWPQLQTTAPYERVQ